MKVENYRILTANVASWVATIISMELIRDFLQIVALFGSVCVSIASIWWIRRQNQWKEEEHKKHESP